MRKLFKHIGMICLALAVAIGSFFVPVRTTNTNSISYAADDSSQINYAFYGSDIMFFETLIYRYNSTTNIALPRFISFDIAIGIAPGAYSFQPHAKLYYYDGTSTSAQPIFYYVIDPNTNNLSDGFFSFTNFDNGYSLNLGRYDTNEEVLPLFIKTDPGFVANVKALNITVTDISTYLGNNFTNVTSNYFSSSVINIRYIDMNDKAFLIQILSPTSFTSQYEDRTYYFVTNFDDNDIYNQGVLDGLNQNQQPIYDDGYSAGFDVGFNLGKLEGTAEANDYSFISLFGALLDAPVTMLMGLLDFDFLGINLWAFLTSLLTLGLVLFVVKLIIGR